MLFKTIIGVFLCFGLTGLAKADWVFTQGTNFVLATKQSCPKTVLRHIVPEHHGRFALAKGQIDGVEYTGCWATLPDNPAVFIVWEDGDTSVLPQAKFKELKEASL